MPKQHKEKFDVGRSLPNMLEDANRKPGVRPRPVVSPKKRRFSRENFSWKKAIVSFFLTLLIVILAAGGWLAYKFEKNCSKTFKDCSIFSLLHTSPLKGEDVGRVNILLAGNSVDDPGHSGAQLTDSIMLVSLDTRNNTGYMLSIPRDLYVSIPGHGYNKINAAYEYGQQENFSEAGYPNGGMGLLEKVVAGDFGVPIDYYALVNYSAFRDLVNAVGGITITINSSDPYGIYDPYTHIKLPNGKVKLDGQVALNLARTRGDGPGSYGVYSDFNRTQWQREMLVAVKDKATNLGTLTNPFKLGNLLDATGKNVTTDFTGDNIRRLASILKRIPDSKIKSVSLNNVDGKGKNLLTSYDSYYSGSALIPAAGIGNYSQFQAYVNQLNQQ